MAKQFIPKSAWSFPPELDALNATPKHHRLLLENEFVRVIDACISPGETTPVHTHQWPSTLFILSFSHFVRYDSKGNIGMDSRNWAALPHAETALWSGPLAPHALQNVGERDLRIISVEVISGINNQV